MAICIAIIGKDNAPFYLASADVDKELELHHRVHSALDVVEEKCQPSVKGSLDSKDLYLGLLYSTEVHKIYGFVTNTKIKFIIVIDSGNIALRENEVRALSLGQLTISQLMSCVLRSVIGFKDNSLARGNIEMFRNLHILYTDAICNPFYLPGEQLFSKKFDRAVQKIMNGNS